MKIILDTSSTNPEYNGGCDYAVVNLTPKLVSQIHRRVGLVRRAAQQDNGVYELYFWGGAADYYDFDLVDACQEAIAKAAKAARQDEAQAVGDWMADLESNGHALLPEGVDLSRHEIQRTECDQTIIRRLLSAGEPEFEVGWLTIPKHSDIYVTTHDLPLDVLDAYTRGKQPKMEEVMQ